MQYDAVVMSSRLKVSRPML